MKSQKLLLNQQIRRGAKESSPTAMGLIGKEFID